MICRLCEVAITKENKCDAHIFPKGMLRAMSPDTLGNLFIVGTDIDRKKRAPTGIYDPAILCRTCDNKLGEYDDYALNYTKNQLLVDQPFGTGWLANGVDQQKLKLFCMSYIWRASITDRIEFGGVVLGESHETKLKNMIKSENTGSIDEYTTILSKFNNSENYGAILLPAKTRFNKLTYYEGYLPHLYKFWIKIDSQVDQKMRSKSLCATESLFVFNRGNFHTSKEKQIMWRAANRSN